MFQTDVAAEMAIPIAIALAGEKSWWYVKKRLFLYWFHVVCEVRYDNGERMSQMLFIDQIDHLLELQHNPDVTIQAVDLVSPAYMNGSNRWMMEPLSEIQMGADADNAGSVHRFILQSGKCYTDTTLSDAAQDRLNDMTTIFIL